MTSPSGEPPPQYWLPLTGYIFWRLQSGDSREQALERAKGRSAFPRLSDAEWQAIGRQAYLEFTGAETARIWEESRPDTPIGMAFGTGAVPARGIGVRVFTTVRLESGAEKEASVIVNCFGGCTINDVFDAAQTWIRENAGSVWGSQYQIDDILEMHVAQLSLIPWDSAPINIIG